MFKLNFHLWEKWRVERAALTAAPPSPSAAVLRLVNPAPRFVLVECSFRELVREGDEG